LAAQRICETRLLSKIAPRLAYQERRTRPIFNRIRFLKLLESSTAGLVTRMQVPLCRIDLKSDIPQGVAMRWHGVLSGSA